jgi:hypothetical protein
MFHWVLFPLLVLTLIGSCVNLYCSWGDHHRLYSASLSVVLAFCLLILMFLCRPRLTIRQIIGLRFASDGEFVSLAQEAAEKSLAADAIKQAVKKWRSDTYRV